MITTKALDGCGPWKYEHRCDKGHPPLLSSNPDPHCPECDDETPLEVHRLRAENAALKARVSELEAQLATAAQGAREQYAQWSKLTGDYEHLEAIVRAVAEIEDPYDHYGSSRCWLCGEVIGGAHLDSCPWVRARKAVGMDVP